MSEIHTAVFKPCSPAEFAEASQFLWSMRDDFRFTEQSTVDDIVQLLFAKGGIIGGYVGDEMVGLFGYFLGEPAQEYRNKDVGFIYIAGIAKAYRHSGAFGSAVDVLAETLQSLGVSEMRCHAAVSDPYTNGIYGRMGQLIGQERNRRGDLCNLYVNSVENVLTMTRDRSRSKSVQPASVH